MPDMPIDHPDNDQLVAFGLGKLDSVEAEKIADHLDSCHDCSETIISMQDDTFVSLVRRAPSPDQQNNPTREPLEGYAPERAVDVTVDGSSGATGDPKDSTELPGELRDHPRYEILELIGRGGMGDVYKAQHRVMNRVVALKIIKPELVRNEAAVARFQREVQAAARLDHGRIVTAHDAEQAGNLHYLVMEFVEGVNLDEVIRDRGALPVAEACNYVQQAAEGLQHAHEHGMVHRDIKPHNLMLSPDGQVRILDFGLAGIATESVLNDADAPVAGEKGATSRHLTIAGSVMGTPDYIAPEQARDAHSADIRADIYSLGCTLYCLLAGEPPHKSDSVVEKLKAHAETEPEAIESIRVDVPEELAEVVRRMMSRNPRDRFQTPAEVADALARFVDKHRTDGGDSGTGLSQTGTTSPSNPLPITFALCFAGTLSILASVLAVVLFLAAEWITGIPFALLSWLKFGGLASLPLGATAIFLADRSERKNSHASAVKAGLLNLLPVNPFVVVLLPLTIWTLIRLRNPSTRVMYETCPSLDREEVRRRWPLVITTVACLLIAIYGGIAIYVQTDYGTVRILVEDPDAKVALRCDDGHRLIRLEDYDLTIGVRSGENTLRIVHGDLEFETDGFDVRRGEKVVVRVSRVEGYVEVRAGDVVIGRERLQSEASIVATDTERLQGVWIAENERWSGELFPLTIGIQRAVFDADKVTVVLPDGEIKEGIFELKTSENPKQIWIQEQGDTNEERGIYKFDGDRLTLRMYDGIDPPKDFDPSSGPTVKTLRKEGTNSPTADVAGQTAKRSDQRLIQGVWIAESGINDGKPIPVEQIGIQRAVFDGDRLSVEMPRGLKGEGHYQLVESASPKQIGIFVSGENKGARGIYKLEGDKLTLCTDLEPGGDLPKDFAAPAGSTFDLIVLRRDALSSEQPEGLDELRRFVGNHLKPVTAVDVSRNGRLILSTSYDRSVRVCDSESGKEICSFLKHGKSAETAEFSANSQLVASSGGDGSVWLWDARTGASVREFKGHTGMVRALAFSPDGDLLVTGSADYGPGYGTTNRDNTLRLWDVETGKEILRFEGVTQAINAAAFAPDGKTVAAGGEYKMVALWDVKSGKQISKFPSPNSHPISMAFSPDGRTIATGHAALVQLKGKQSFFDPENSVVCLWDVASRRLRRQLRGHTAPVNAVSFSSDGRLVVSACGGHHHDYSWYPAQNNSLRVWDRDSGEQLLVREFSFSIESLALFPDDNSIVVCGGDLAIGHGDDQPDIVLWSLPESVWPKTPADNERIQGKWKRIALTDNGEEQSIEDRAERFITFTGEQFTGPQQKQPKPGKFSLDVTASPKQIDLHFPSGPNSFIHIRGIYRLEGDRLTIFQATDWTASKRPTTFEPKPDDKRSLLIFERVRDWKELQGTWKAVALEASGQEAPESAFKDKCMVIRGDTMSRVGRLGEVEALLDFRDFRIDPTTSPKALDLSKTDDGEFAEFSQSIYEVDGDTLRVCFSQQSDAPRPKSFDTAGTRYFCFTLKREEPATDPLSSEAAGGDDVP